MVMRRRLLGTAVLVVTLLAGCANRTSHALFFGDGRDDGGFGMTIPDVPEDTPFTFGATTLCVRGAPSVTVTGIRAVDPSDISIDGFAVSTEYIRFGAEIVDLKGAGFDPTSHDVTASCGSDYAWLAVQVRRTSHQKAMMSSFVVEYVDASGRRGELEFFGAVTLCGPGDKSGTDDDWVGGCVKT